MGCAPSVKNSSLWQRVSRFLRSLISSSKIQEQPKPVSSAKKTKNVGVGKGEIRVDVPILSVPFGGGVEGETYIPVLAPTKERYPVTSDFGPRIDPIDFTKKEHKGVDLGTPVGTIIHPPDKGTVITAQFKPDGAGRRVVIGHQIGHTGRTYHYCSAYFHLSEIRVKVGQDVSRETIIGLSGGNPKDPESGRTTSPHLHFETRTPPPEYMPV